MKKERFKTLKKFLKIPLMVFAFTLLFFMASPTEEAHAHEGYIKNKTFKISNLGKDAKVTIRFVDDYGKFNGSKDLGSTTGTKITKKWPNKSCKAGTISVEIKNGTATVVMKNVDCHETTPYFVVTSGTKKGHAPNNFEVTEEGETGMDKDTGVAHRREKEYFREDECKVYGGVGFCADEITLNWDPKWLYINFCSPSGTSLGEASYIYGNDEFLEPDVSVEYPDWYDWSIVSTWSLKKGDSTVAFTEGDEMDDYVLENGVAGFDKDGEAKTKTIKVYYINKAPSVSMSSTNNQAGKQTVKIHVKDDEYIKNYYWGTDGEDYKNNKKYSKTGSYTDEEDYRNITVSEGGTYYLTAVDGWGAVTTKEYTFYEVTWDANGGTCSTPKYVVYSGKSVIAPSVSRKGFTTNGWTNKTFGTVKPGETAGPIESDVTFKTSWNASKLTVKYYSSSGTSWGSQTLTYGTSTKLNNASKSRNEIAGGCIT